MSGRTTRGTLAVRALRESGLDAQWDAHGGLVTLSVEAAEIVVARNALLSSAGLIRGGHPLPEEPAESRQSGVDPESEDAP
jgi:hypothetical protein